MDTVLNHYAKMVPFLAAALGSNVEIALHDLSSQTAPIIAIANNEISGRQIGDGVTSLGVHILEEKQYETKEYVINYKTISSSGKLLRSSSYFIRNDANEVVGMLCINVNISDYEYLQATIQRILGIQAEEEDMEYRRENPIQVLSGTLERTVNELTSETLVELGYPPYYAHERLSVDEKLDVMKHLYDNGVFTVKGAIPIVAKELSVSEPTVYRYLKKIGD